MNKLIYFIIFIVLLNSCGQDTKMESKKSNSVSDTLVTNPENITLLQFQCNNSDSLIPESSVKVLAKRLLSLDNNYQIKSIEKGDKTKSIILRGLSKLEKLRSNNRENYIEISNLDDLNKSISEINFCYVKGTKDLGQKLYARAKIEELIFRTTDCAVSAQKIIEQVRNSGFIHEEIDKAPSSLIRKENKLYYISAGGHYMRDFYKKIEEKLTE